MSDNDLACIEWMEREGQTLNPEYRPVFDALWQNSSCEECGR